MKAHTVRDARFVASAARADQLPELGAPEIAFAGRSNVGKSSLMNMLLGRKGLVRTSKTPGCTRAINFFAVELGEGEAVTFVDLPGYGFASRSKKERRSWAPLISGYLDGRALLRAVCVLVDVRRGIEKDDEGLIDLVVSRGLVTIVVATKIDKIPRAKRKPALVAMQRKIREPLVAASSVTGEGRTELLDRLLCAIEDPAL
jgi:GTP-binding protein